MKEKIKGSALTRINELHYLYVCTSMLDKAIQTIAPHLFTEEQLVSLNVHLGDIMRSLNNKAEELNI